MDGYLHALKMEFGKEAKGILVDGALVHAGVREFTLIPIEKITASLGSWLWEVHHELELIENNDRDMEIHRDKSLGCDLDFLPAFPKNDNSCIQFMKPCPYTDLCRSRADPELEPDRVPAGFRVQKWSPFDELKLHKILGEDSRE